MNSRDDHGSIDQLLPLYANGSLDAGTRRRIAAHLVQCAECREELKFLGDVRQVLRGSVAAERAITSPAEARFESLPAELQLRVRDTAVADRARPSLAVVVGMAAALFAAVALGVALTVTQIETPPYRTATNPAATAADHVRVAVRFGADVEFGQVNQLLRRHRAIIVQGPDENDRWLLEIPVANAARADGLLPELRRTPGIEAVERIGTPETGE